MMRRILESYFARILESYFAILGSVSANASRLSRRARIGRLLVLVLIVAGITTLCGVVSNVRTVLVLWAWILLGIVPLMAGIFLIFNKAMDNQVMAMLMFGGLLAFVTFAISLSSLLLDERLPSFGWRYAVNVSLIAAAAIYLVILLFTVIASLFSSGRNKKH